MLHPLHVSGCGNVMSLVEILSFTTCHYNGKDLGTSFPQGYVDAQKYLMMNGFITAPDKLNVSPWMEGGGAILHPCTGGEWEGQPHPSHW